MTSDPLLRLSWTTTASSDLPPTGPGCKSVAFDLGYVFQGEFLRSSRPPGAALGTDGIHVAPRPQHPGIGVVEHHDEGVRVRVEV